MATINDNTAEANTNSIHVLLKFGIATVFALLLLWGIQGRMVVEKLATLLIMPCGIIWYLLMVCVVLAYSHRQRTQLFMGMTAWLMYTVCGSGHLACLLANHIEAPFLNIDPTQQAPLDAIVVLGGGATVAINQRFQGNSSGDRVILAAQLYHAGIASKIICTGKRIVSVDGEGPDSAQVSAGVLTALGVPESAIETMGGHNTSEEMQNLSKHFSGSQERIGLVTSAWHLPRALRLADRWDLNFEPLPADFISGKKGPATMAQTIMSCIPQADNFMNVTRILKEHLAGTVGR